MSNTIAHLVVANRIIKACPQLVSNADAYYLGSIAPDTIGSKPGCAREDKRRVHLREDIRDSLWLNQDKMDIFNARILDFVDKHIDGAEGSQRDFNMGYLVHLLTDKWNHKTIRQTMLAIANANNVNESDREFFHMMTNDLEALDNYLLTQEEEISLILNRVFNLEVGYSLDGFIDKEYIKNSIWWWKEKYLVNIKQRQLKYISESDITQFIDLAAKEIVGELKSIIKGTP